MSSMQETELKNTEGYASGPAVAGTAPPGAYGSPTRMESSRSYYTEDPRAKSSVLAMVLSLMPGLGQVYLGFYQLGFIHVLVVASIIATLAHGVPGYLEPLLGVFLAFFWLYNVVDAGRRASLYNQALAGLGPMEVPGGVLTYESGGSLVGGIVLVLVGLLFFAHTRFGMPLEWLERWWPVALILAGVYLIIKAVQDRQKE